LQQFDSLGDGRLPQGKFSGSEMLSIEAKIAVFHSFSTGGPASPNFRLTASAACYDFSDRAMRQRWLSCRDAGSTTPWVGTDPFHRCARFVSFR
jgi:hypothetical protein